MNRETKRAMARQQRTAGDQAARLQQLRRQQAARQQTGRREGAAPRRGGAVRAVSSFGGEVTTELKRVNWPDRRTVVGYTIVVLVAVSVITAIIAGLDFLFGKAVLAVFGN